MNHYDVIVVGGRVSGSTLATRLAQAGLSVLLIERQMLPAPHPASSPVINTAAMAYLDEIGADERAYAEGVPPAHRFVYEIRESFRVFNPTLMAFGRDYGYAVDRAQFDFVLWELALRHGVTGMLNTAVSQLLWDDHGRVIGVEVRQQRQTSRYTADLVVGADGRFSTVARQVNAREHHAFNRLPTSAIYAYWDDVAPYDESGIGTMHFISPQQGVGILLLPSAHGRTAVTIEGQSKKLESGSGQKESLYHEILRNSPAAWRRVKHGRVATPLHGMRHIGNLYRQSGGPGWALTGDALHQKDPVDGQGIHDAIFTSRALAAAILRWQSGAQSWEQARAQYDQEVWAEMHPMYIATMLTIFEYFYIPLDNPLTLNAARWLYEDPEYRRRLAMLLGRMHPNAARWRPLPVLIAALGRGMAHDVRRWWQKTPRPSQHPGYNE
jgi:flavin-dependent dehydrogenase